MDITELLTKNLQSTDGSERDKAVDDICTIIINDEINNNKKVEIFNYCTKMIFVNVGEIGGSYIRAYNLLVLQCLLEDNLTKKFLSSEYLDKFFNKFAEYIKLERTELGYSKKVGWIHTYAHACDVFVTLLQYGNFVLKDSEYKLFVLFTKKYISKSYIYVHDEAARLFRMFNYVDQTNEFVDNLTDLLEKIRINLGNGVPAYFAKQNFYNYLHVLRFFTDDMELLKYINFTLENKYLVFKDE